MIAAFEHAASRLSLPRHLQNGPRRQGFASPRKNRAPLTAPGRSETHP
jgi:hypothetical protein